MSLLTTADLVKVLRSSVNVQDTEGVIDPAYLSMTDEDIELFIKLGVSRAYPDVTDLDSLPSGSEFPIILLAKIELYTKLAVLKADKIDLGAESAYLKQDQRFQHYMALAKMARDSYMDWFNSDGSIVNTYDVHLAKRKPKPLPLTDVMEGKINVN